jgi:hypothetical protein
MALTRQSLAVAKKPRKTKTQRKASGRGKAKMNAAADKTLEENSEKIAKSLLKSTLGGNASSAKLLFALADGQIDCEDEEAVRHLHSMAEQLAAEPEWNAKKNKETVNMSLVQSAPKD